MIPYADGMQTVSIYKRQRLETETRDGDRNKTETKTETLRPPLGAASEKKHSGNDSANARLCSEVVAFPLSKRSAFIRQTAEAIISKNASVRELYWRTQTRRLARQLRALGLAPQAIDAELAAFKVAVQCDLNRLVVVSRWGGAA
ncbi:DUF6074 family protein [Rhizobium sp. HT1-10]|uniref:DUF6074 family protein n=1 Tax=Rhizobium sp. HT1-10 TaxID=3111638 RepID=UPI003C210BB6